MKHLISKGALLLFACAFQTSLFAQMQYYKATTFGSRFNDINDNGLAISTGGYFDFPTLTWTDIEPEAIETVSLNNNGDVAGSMWYDEELFIFQPAYKKNGVWNPIGWFPESNPQESSYSIFSISPNGVWVTGQMSIGCCDFGTFKYNTETNVLTPIFNEDYVAVAGYVVTNDGTIGGWADDEFGGTGGTRRIPVYITPELEIIPVGDELPELSVNAVNDINASFTMVGDFDSQPFIFDGNTNNFTTFEIPFSYFSATFTSISNEGVAVGYAQRLGEFGNPERDAIIYHPDLGSQPVFIKDILLLNGIDINAPSGRMGTAIAISNNGEYIAGWEDTSPFFASGWIVYLDDLLFADPVCAINCPDNIDLIAPEGETSAVVEYEVSFNCGDGAPEVVNLVLVSGPASGSAFPFGTTAVTYNLVDGEGNLINFCTFYVTVSDEYCSPSIQFLVEPISKVVVADINNSSTVDPSAPGHEFFLDVVGNMDTGQSYPISLEGYTGGEYINFFTVFIDFNQDGEFNTTTEMFEIGSIENSTGLDGQAATGTITIPEDAALGVTRMRIIKSADVSPVDPCWSYFFGQIEDYTVVIDLFNSTTSAEQISMSVYPNPVNDILRINSEVEIETVTIFNISGQAVMQQTLRNSQAVIDLSSFSSGIYSMVATSKDASRTFKVVKL
jgi:hypothetical protein